VQGIARRVLVGAMEATGILPARRRRADPGRAVILRYHSVSHFDASGRLYRSPSIALPPEMFEQQMRFLADWYHVVPLSRLVQCLLEREPFPPRAVAITFDDGYRDNFVNALPILRSFGFQATVYVTTGAIGDGWRFWPSRLRSALLETSKNRIDLDELGIYDLSSEPAREVAVKRLTLQLKLQNNEQRAALLDRLVAETGHDAPLDGSDTWFMSWDELRAMAAAGIEIGAHTLSHPILTRLSDESADREIRQSREDLEAGLGGPVHHFAYPNGGGVINHDGRIANLVRAAGFLSATTSVNGVVRRDTDPFRISRLGVAQRHSVDGLALNLERDRLFTFS
jgi:peptidoglycan/xylan/chitin deacetylase (PgdA/CDA1 family)